MGLSNYYKSSLYSIPEEEPEEKKPTRAPYGGRKSMFLERPVEIKKLPNVSHSVMEDLKETHETESSCSGINLKKECDIKKEDSNNDCNIPDPKTTKMSLEDLRPLSIEIENTLKDFPIANQQPGSMKMQDLNNNCNLTDPKTAKMSMEELSPLSIEIENTHKDFPNVNQESRSDKKTQNLNNNCNLPDPKTAEMFVERSSPFSIEAEKSHKDFPNVNQKPGSEMRKQDLNNICNLTDQKTAQVFEYSSPSSIQNQNTPTNFPNVNLKSGSDPLSCPQTCPDNRYYVPPLSDTSNLYYQACESLQLMNCVNFSTLPSTDPYCADLPFLEPYTLQFFYNLGWEYFHAVNVLNNYCYLQPFISEQNPDYFPEFKNPEQNPGYFPRFKKQNYNNSGYSYGANFNNQRGFRKDGLNRNNNRKKKVNNNNAWNGGQRTFNRSYVYQ